MVEGKDSMQVWVVDGKDDISTLKSHESKTCPVVKGQGNSDKTTPVGAIFMHNNDDIRESFCKFMIQVGMLINHFDNPWLTRILQKKMQPQYRQVSHTTLRGDGIMYWGIAKRGIQLGFFNIKTVVSLICDVWSSTKNCPKNYPDVTTHWIDLSTWVMNKRVIAFVLIAHPHTSVIAAYNLRDKIFAISFDNASNNAAAAKRIFAKYKPIFDTSFIYTRCVCHIINLAVEDGLRIIYSMIEKLKSVLIRVFGKHIATMEKYRRFALSININAYSPHCDVD
uniref:DUF659 domain-containing protein n=1 Tax=Lactuca sativa TaxID=4236 RepID=A0A9R1WRV5_LACSA|nr:hypothetical protein LSAT_V11C100028060 [Lactuca sativa]